MATNPAQSMPEVDWEILILEVQTAPAETLETAQNALYLVIYAWIDDIAARFAQKYRVAESDIMTLSDLGVAQVMKKIDKFELRATDPSNQGIQFKAWVTTVCRNRWYDEYRKTRRDGARLQSDQAARAKELQDHWDNEIHHRDPDDWDRMSAAYESCLSKYPKHYQNAIVETEALRQEQGTPEGARGRAGEAREIAERHGVNQNTVRKYRERLKQCIRDAYAKDSKP